MTHPHIFIVNVRCRLSKFASAKTAHTESPLARVPQYRLSARVDTKMVWYISVLQVAFTSDMDGSVACLAGSFLCFFLSLIGCNLLAADYYHMMRGSCIRVGT